MTNDEQEHEDLKRLFEDTAQVASGPTLTKLAARARDIPERAAQKRRFLPRWAWGPAFAGALMTLGGLFALRVIAPKPTPQRAADVASAAPVLSVSAGHEGADQLAVASVSPLDALAEAAAPKSMPADDSSDNPELLGDSDEGAHFDVTGPQSDRDLDAWLAATKELSGGT